MTVTFDSIDRATLFWGRVSRGEQPFLTRNQYHRGRKIHWRVLNAKNLRWVSMSPPVLSMDAEFGPAVLA